MEGDARERSSRVEMTDHFACLGFAVTRENFSELVRGLARDAAEVHPLPGGGRTVVWQDPSGARVAIDLDAEGKFDCVRPGFASTTRVSLELARMSHDEGKGCPSCDVLLAQVIAASGERVYPIATVLENVTLARDFVRPRTLASGSVNALAEELTVWADEAAYLASAPKMAPEALIPVGTFTPPGRPPRAPSAYVLMTGVVLAASRRTNARSGGAFDWCRVRSHGQEYELLASPRDLERPLAPGNVIRTVAWLSVRLDVPPAVGSGAQPR